jgi:hypothetical protein
MVMNTAFRLLPALSLLISLGCYGDKIFVEDGAGGGPPNSTSTSGGAPPSGGNGNGGGGEAPSTGGSGGEAPTGCTSPAQCPNPASECVVATCEAMTCGEENKAQGDACAGGRCDGEGACVECLDNTDCTAPETCDPKSHECIAPQCSNGSLDTGETDIDCGGTMCPGCENTDDCVVGGDCVSGFCNSSLVCAACMADGNCNSATQYCAAGVCMPKLTDGTTCASNGQCESASCVASSIGPICCNSACTGACLACAMNETGQANGTCFGTLANIDPDNDCPTQPCRTGSCSGSMFGGCGISPANASCNDSLFCNGTDTCDGSGNCSNHSGNPCPGEATPDADCSESCNEAADNCTANDATGTPCNDTLFCNGSPDMCNGSGSCVPSSNPCPGHNTAFNCNDSCNETNNNCTANDVAGTSCNHDSDLQFGMCATNGSCSGD